ncbi:MAG TPA: hypothetical protein VE218_02700, partial [Acidobacteriaceae bacterium]|nr:hypothetical protein [Acidobacteriaceae bacterium]
FGKWRNANGATGSANGVRQIPGARGHCNDDCRALERNMLTSAVMGAWGTAVFSDDTACDVRESYLDHLGDGLSGPDATKALLRQWSGSLTDRDESPVFWLSLAATQWRCGRLESEVLREALNVINNGSDLARWHPGSKDFNKRKLVLEKLRLQLTSSQPPEKRVSKRFRDSNEWAVGDLVAYRLPSGRFVILRTIGHHSDKGGTSPICELLDWNGEHLPRSFESFGVLKSSGIRPMTQFMIGRVRAKERPEERLQHLGVNISPSQKPHQYTVLLWRWFDKTLREKFGLE